MYYVELNYFTCISDQYILIPMPNVSPHPTKLPILEKLGQK